jgi:hypothetical protein
MNNNRYESFAVECEMQQEVRVRELQVHLFSKKALFNIVFLTPNRKERILSGARHAHFEGFIHVEPLFGG